MEIRQQYINRSEIIRWINENVGHAFLRMNFSTRTSCRFQGADRCRSHGDDSARVIDLACGFHRNGKTLRVHAMLRYALRAHREKCSRSHMQGDERVWTRAQNFRGEVKTGRGRGKCASRIS